jgi:hypothetical protein
VEQRSLGNSRQAKNISWNVSCAIFISMKCVSKDVWIKKSESFKSAADFNLDYYLSMNPQERLDTMQFLRRIAFNIKKERNHGKGRKRLQRVLKVIQ